MRIRVGIMSFIIGIILTDVTEHLHYSIFLGLYVGRVVLPNLGKDETSCRLHHEI